jgi:hypothetical protein
MQPECVALRYLRSSTPNHADARLSPLLQAFRSAVISGASQPQLRQLAGETPCLVDTPRAAVLRDLWIGA